MSCPREPTATLLGLRASRKAVARGLQRRVPSMARRKPFHFYQDLVTMPTNVGYSVALVCWFELP